MNPTGFLTDAPWITDVLCDKLTRPHTHIPLGGHKPWGRKDRVWDASLAGDYSGGMCNKLAKDFQFYSTTAEPAKQPPATREQQKAVKDPLLENVFRQ